jgi:hypothetical protein
MYDSITLANNYVMNTSDFENKACSSVRFHAIREHLYSDLKDEAVILSVATGKYYGINAVGVTIWKAIQDPSTIEEIEAAVMREYDVERETCSGEIRSFLMKMANEKLIEETLDEQTA